MIKSYEHSDAKIHAIYIHIPFCSKRCYYCSFYSNPLSATKQESNQRFDDYLNGVCNDLKQFLKVGVDLSAVRTIYFGGGTPSLIPPDLWKPFLQRFFEWINDRVPLSQIIEITAEANPESLTPELIDVWSTMGINRISLGCQSFFNPFLYYVGRPHTREEINTAIQRLQSVGIGSMSIDLIYGLPGQTLDDWKRELDTFLSLDIPHISCYALDLTEKTVLYRHIQQGKTPSLPTDEVVADMLLHTIDILTQHGYHQYEISNFARPGHESQHNLTYWDMDKSYLGLGTSASGFISNQRYTQVSDISLYLEDVHQSTWQRIQWEPRSLEDQWMEYLMVALRKTEGLSIAMAGSKWNRSFGLNIPIVKQCLEEGLIQINSGYLQVTKKGLPVLDSLIIALQGTPTL